MSPLALTGQGVYFVLRMPTVKNKDRTPPKPGRRQGRPRTRKRKPKTRRPAMQAEKLKRGRPTRATAFLLFKILLARREGLGIRYCGGPAGITHLTLDGWLKEAEQHASGWHGKTLPRPTSEAYVVMDRTLRDLATCWEVSRELSIKAQAHIAPDYSGITDFRLTGIGHWLAFLDQWEAITAVYVNDRAGAIKSSGDWKAHAWLLERFARDDYGRLDTRPITATLDDAGELNVSLRIAPPAQAANG